MTSSPLIKVVLLAGRGESEESGECSNSVTMSGVVEMVSGRSADQKEFTVATPQEFVRKFGGIKVITRVSISALLMILSYPLNIVLAFLDRILNLAL